MAKKIDELQESLRKKDEDMKQMEERYKRYVEKARTVIKTLDPMQQPVTATPDIQALKNQLTEKERKIQHLEHDYEKSRARHDQEEKLIITAWYNMVSERANAWKHEADLRGRHGFHVENLHLSDLHDPL